MTERLVVKVIRQRKAPRYLAVLEGRPAVFGRGRTAGQAVQTVKDSHPTTFAEKEVEVITPE